VIATVQLWLPRHAVARVRIGPVLMDAFTIPSSSGGEIVLLAIDDDDLRAMIALTLEMAGYRVVPVDALGNTCARAQEVRPHAVVADLRDGDAGAWKLMHRLQSEESTGAARLVVITQSPDDVPVEILQRGAAIVRWPFDVVDLVRVLAGPSIRKPA
jgi:DNA-binding response OmpR family regulator